MKSAFPMCWLLPSTFSIDRRQNASIYYFYEINYALLSDLLFWKFLDQHTERKCQNLPEQLFNQKDLCNIILQTIGDFQLFSFGDFQLFSLAQVISRPKGLASRSIICRFLIYFQIIASTNTPLVCLYKWNLPNRQTLMDIVILCKCFTVESLNSKLLNRQKKPCYYSSNYVSWFGKNIHSLQ